MLRILFFIMAVGEASTASAQVGSVFPTPNPGSLVPLFLQGCLNSSGQAVPCGSSGAIGTPTNDPNNAAFSTPTPFTVGGAPVLVGRSTAAVCTAGGTVTYTMPGGSFQWPVVIGGQIMPFAVTGATAGPACTYTNLN